MTQAKLDLQREVVINERRQSFENRPYGRVDLVLSEQLYPPSSPYHHPVIGSQADLERATLADVKAFFRTYYVASNLSLAISGDFDPTEARRLVERYLGPLPTSAEPLHATASPVVLARSKELVLQDDVQLEQLTLVWPAPAFFAPDDAECTLLAGVLGGGRASRLVRALVAEQQIAETVEVEHHPNRYAGEFAIVATARPGRTAAELRTALDRELQRLLSEPPTAEEVARARALIEVKAIEAIETPAGVGELLNAFEFSFGDPGQLERSWLARFEAVDASAVAVEARLLTRPRVAITVKPRAVAKEARR
jgi:zinc protease